MSENVLDCGTMSPFLYRPLALLLLALCHTAAAQTPTRIVQDYLDARAAGQYEKAYALLSPEDTPHLDERLAPISAFFLDTHDTRHYAFRVLGLAPVSSDSVPLFTQKPGAPSGTRIPLHIVTASEGNGPPRLDLSRSLDGTLRRERERARQATSHSNLRTLALGILQYAMDHDDHLPDARRWTDEVMPYVKDRRLFHDPSAPDGPQGHSYSYAFNRSLSGKRLAKVTSPYSTVLLFESTKNVKNASDTGQSVPRPGRHSGGTDYAFADGHVKWVKDGSYMSRNKELLSYTLSGK